MADGETTIDLNADLGEGYPYDAELLRIVSSCNVACGGHAGDMASMEETMRVALDNGVNIGAHPSYPDRDGFGRKSGFMKGEALYESLRQQLTAFCGIADSLGATITHVKAHGALYTDAVVDAGLADVVARAAASLPGKPKLVGQPGTELEHVARRHELGFVAEAFVDRAYQPNGRLVPRREAGAVHDTIGRITEQAVSLAMEGRVRGLDGVDIAVRADTLCIHGDTPDAAHAARAVRRALESHGVQVHAFE